MDLIICAVFGYATYLPRVAIYAAKYHYVVSGEKKDKQSIKHLMDKIIQNYVSHLIFYAKTNLINL